MVGVLAVEGVRRAHQKMSQSAPHEGKKIAGGSADSARAIFSSESEGISVR
jgi:hypothetical protein